MQTKPAIRSNLRMLIGKTYFILKRYFLWLTLYSTYARKKDDVTLPYIIFKHKSLLFKDLQNEKKYLQKNKVINLGIAIKKINHLLIKPGELFSFWYLVGKPSAVKGYKTGMILHNGKIQEEVGGGLCQLSNLIYWMTLHTELTVTERWRHNYDVFPDENRSVPFGSGATVAYNYVDLQIKNETNKAYQLSLQLNNQYLEGVWLSDMPAEYTYEVFEQDPRINTESWGGFTRHNKLFRQKKIQGKAIGEAEFICENNAFMMYNPLLGTQALKK